MMYRFALQNVMYFIFKKMQNLHFYTKLTPFDVGKCAEVKKLHNHRRYNKIYEGGV